MASEEVLRKTLKNADGKPFAKYKGLQNNFVLDDFELIFDEVQNDRAGHSRLRVRVPLKNAGFPEDAHDTPERDIALRDLVARRFWESARTHARSPIPKTDGGELYIPRPGQEILERGSVVFTEYFVEVRFTADLPSSGGKASAMAMELLIFSRIATVVSESMFFLAYKQSKVYNHIRTYENYCAVRRALPGMGLAAFVAEGSILPRREDNLAPMIDAVPFACADALKVSVEVPFGEPLVGMGVPKGFTAICGPGRSGKTVLADALFSGIYAHIPGDGREYVVTDPTASYVMSEHGRAADAVDVSMFISTPEFADPSRAQAETVSASSSAFVSISEAIGAGSGLILMDEGFVDPCVIRKGFMSDASVIPVSEAAQSMAEQGVSTVVVTGDESAAMLAGTVVVMNGFKASKADVEQKVVNFRFIMPKERFPVSKGIPFEKARKEVSTAAVSVRCVEIGERKVDVPVAGIFDMAQTHAIADAIVVAKEMMDGSRSMADLCRAAIEAMNADDASTENGNGMHHAEIRPVDLAAVLDRHPQMLAIQKG